MPTLAVAASSEMAVSAAAASHSVAAPAGVAVGDMLFAFHSMAAAGSLAAMTAPSGWSVGGDVSGPMGHLRLFTLRAIGPVPGPIVFGGSASAHSRITIIRVSGTYGTVSWAWSLLADPTPGTARTAPGGLISPKQAPLAVVAWGGPVGGSAVTWTPATGWTAAGTAAQAAQQHTQFVAAQTLSAGGMSTVTAATSVSMASGATALSLMVWQDKEPVSARGPFTRLRVEAQFDAVNWTDISDRLTSGGVEIRRDRATRFDEPGPAVCTFTLTNPDGMFTPDNPASTLWPTLREGVPVRVTAIRGAYATTRFVGTVRVWSPEFPGGQVARAVTKVAATDALARHATARMASSWINSARYSASVSGARFDTFLMAGDGDATTYFDNLTTSPGAKARARTVPHPSKLGALSFGAADGLSIESSVQFNPANGGGGSVVKIDTSGNTFRALVFWVKFPSSVQSAAGNPVDVLHFYNADNSVSYGSIRLQLNGSQDDLNYFNAAGTLVGGFAGNVGRERWTMVSLRTVTATPTQTTMFYHYLDGTGGSVGTYNLDLRNVRHLWFGGLGNDVAQMEVAGITLWGSESSFTGNPQEGLTGGTPWTVGNRLAALNLVTPTLIYGAPGSDLSQSVVTGNWHGRTALDVSREIARSSGAMITTHPQGGYALVVGANLLRQEQVAITLDAEGELLGTLRMSRGMETRPTRVTVRFAAGAATVIDTAAEADAEEQRPITVATILPDDVAAEALAADILAQVANDIEISQATVDLEGCAANVAEDVCDLAFPGRRIRLTGLPLSHFGSTTRDVWIEGWVEAWTAVGQSRFTFDLSPAESNVAAIYPAANRYPWTGLFPIGA